ncbi:division/cell wall cluster transcriptional repressor MraZ [Georgenia sp. SUBG003]|uniref:division/cell wall cluster transcriptional repressor MraZ n=1 Tax=Georgenia sp. SUBG003 TaxID=1497974 RepID=UPI003AB3FA38
MTTRATPMTSAEAVAEVRRGFRVELTVASRAVARCRPARAASAAPAAETARGTRLSGAADEVPDKQGRVTIPPALRKYAGLTRDLAVIGAGTRIEIWDAAAWETYLTEQEQAFAETAEEVVPGLF